ncbi:lysozyme inhibitor LprI family protein [Luteimonas huabeiensis]|uniref:lysozyme inhibitor LprI family protein n=1 Tax=Luteimonas huabeiensis TaxID=1244513 RepID=UPI0004632327|nr:lysozyme inhibitor LprI family protein [Luteimonas huabeiensis]
MSEPLADPIHRGESDRGNGEAARRRAIGPGRRPAGALLGALPAVLLAGALGGCQPPASTDGSTPAGESTESRGTAGTGDAPAAAEATLHEDAAAAAADLRGAQALPEEVPVAPASSDLVDIAPADLRPSFQTCLDASGGVTPAMQDCIDEEYGFQDDRLNAAYRALMERTPGSGRDALRDEQRRWIEQRDAACSPGERPGQGQILDAGNCEVNATANRAAVLERR